MNIGYTKAWNIVRKKKVVNNSEQIRFQKRVNRGRSSPEPSAYPYMPGREPLGGDAIWNGTYPCDFGIGAGAT